VDEAGLEASRNLDSLSYSNYETSFSKDLNVKLTATHGWQNSMRFPDDDSAQLRY